jgi:peptidoglycan/xylan/chitin deacetylase (PgdA/CDA1 family)
MLFTPTKLLKRMMPSLVWNMGDAQDVFLTFDDGPTPGNTEWIVDTLAKYDAKATFFCLGKNVEQHPESFRRIIEAGHKAGNHTYSHQRGWGMSLERYVEDVDFANQLVRSDLFRPPYGRIKPSQARKLSERYDLIMWDVLSRDYSNLITPRQCANNVIKHVRAGSIVVFHDSPKSSRNMRYALPRVLDYLSERGLKCSTIEL